MREVSPLKKIIDESPKIRALKEKRRKAKKRLRVLLAILFIVLVGGAVYAARYPKLQLEKVIVSGNQVIDTSDITAIAHADLAGNYAYVIPHRNSFFYPKKKIIADLIQKFPRFKTVQVWRQDLSTVLVTVTEVRGHALWCGEDTTLAAATSTPVSAAPNPCYFTDDQGKIVSLAPQYSGNVYLRFYGGTIDPSDIDPLGKTFVDGASFQQLLAFQAKLVGLGFNVRALEIGTDDTNTFLVDVAPGKTATIPFLKDDDYGTLVANLTVTMAQPEVIAKMKADKANLQYFDLRFTNKVYYKFSDDTTTAAAAPDTGPTASYESALGH